MPSPKKFVEVIEDTTGKAVKAFDVTKMSESQKARLIRGIEINLNHAAFTVRERTEKRKVHDA